MQVSQVPEELALTLGTHGGQDLLQRHRAAVLQVHQAEDLQTQELVGPLQTVRVRQGGPPDDSEVLLTKSPLTVGFTAMAASRSGLGVSGSLDNKR